MSATDGRSAAEEWLVISGHGGESTGTLLGPGAVDVLQDAVAAPAVGERVGVTVRWHTRRASPGSEGPGRELHPSACQPRCPLRVQFSYSDAKALASRGLPAKAGHRSIAAIDAIPDDVVTGS